MGLDNVANSAIQGLERKTFGGVSRESAEKGIRDVQAEGERQIQELSNDVANKSQVILANNTTIKDLKAQLATSQAANTYATQQLTDSQNELKETKGKLSDTEEKLSDTQEKLSDTSTKLDKANESLKNKTTVKEHKDGSVTIRKSNKNGTRMTIEKNPYGQVTSVEVEQLDGYKRTTTFDEKTGTRRQTITDDNGEVVATHEYDDAGNLKKTTAGEVEEVKVLNRSEEIRDEHKLIKEEFSNGETLLTFIPLRTDRPAFTQRSKDGRIIEQTFEKIDADGRGDKYHISYGEGSTIAEYVEYVDGKEASTQKTVAKKDPNGVEYTAQVVRKDSNGTEVVMNAVTNSYGQPVKQVVHTTFGKSNGLGFDLKEGYAEYQIIDRGPKSRLADRYETKHLRSSVSTTDGKIAEFVGDESSRNSKVIKNEICPNVNYPEDRIFQGYRMHGGIGGGDGFKALKFSDDISDLAERRYLPNRWFAL